MNHAIQEAFLAAKQAASDQTQMSHVSAKDTPPTTVLEAIKAHENTVLHDLYRIRDRMQALRDRAFGPEPQAGESGAVPQPSGVVAELSLIHEATNGLVKVLFGVMTDLERLA